MDVFGCCCSQRKCSIFAFTSGKEGLNILGTNTGTVSRRMRDRYDGKLKDLFIANNNLGPPIDWVR